MRTKITCSFSVISSNEIVEPGFRGGNKLVLTLPLSIKNPMELSDTALEVTEAHDGSYQITITSAQLTSKILQIEFVEKIAEYLSFLINRDEKNPRYGNLFIKINWFNFSATSIREEHDGHHETVHISDSLSITSTRNLQLLEKDWRNATYNDMLRFYFDGLRAEHEKSKYFHWFLILEYLENSKKYAYMFAHDKLFNEAESKIIEDAANNMSDTTKKGAVKNLLSRTREFRSAKLLKFINAIGISDYSSNGKSVKLTEETLKAITKGRNAIFHSGSVFPDAALWNDLFPLATLIVEQISMHKISIDAVPSASP